jgi:hypothetical protein
VAFCDHVWGRFAAQFDRGLTLISRARSSIVKYVRSARKPVADAAPPRARREAVAGERESLAAPVLRLQRSAGNRATARLLQRSELTTGPAPVLRLVIGPDVGWPFAALAWAHTRDGPLDDSAIALLRRIALGDETIDDNERMFIAALIDGANASKLHAEHPSGLLLGETIEFSAASITTTNRARVRDYDRTKVPTRIALHKGDEDAVVVTNIMEVAGAFSAAARDALAIAHAAHVPPAELLAAMLSGASDSTAGDRAFAGAVYAIAKQEHMGVAADILAGRIKVDEVTQSPMPKNAAGMYESEAGSGGAKGDTVYLPSNLSFLTLTGQATVVHELTHAGQDKATESPTKSPVVDAEEESFRAEADFLLTAIARRTGEARKGAVEEVAKEIGPPTLLCMVLVATEVLCNDTAIAALKDVYDEVRWAGHPDTIASLKRDEFTDLLVRTADEDLHYDAVKDLEGRIAKAITSDYRGIEPATDAGLRGESQLDRISPARRR